MTCQDLLLSQFPYLERFDGHCATERISSVSAAVLSRMNVEHDAVVAEDGRNGDRASG